MFFFFLVLFELLIIPNQSFMKCMFIVNDFATQHEVKRPILKIKIHCHSHLNWTSITKWVWLKQYIISELPLN